MVALKVVPPPGVWEKEDKIEQKSGQSGARNEAGLPIWDPENYWFWCKPQLTLTHSLLFFLLRVNVSRHPVDRVSL